MVGTAMHDHLAIREGTRGGVVNLLRMARVHCGASVAFSALRTAGGSFSIAAYPPPGTTLTGDEPDWGVEVLRELVEQAWVDPTLAQARAVVRRVRPRVEGPLGTVDVAVAAVPLCDLLDPLRPWGLLVVARSSEADFDPAQVDTLAGLGRRLTAYLRAREQLLQDSGEPEPPSQPAGTRLEEELQREQEPRSSVAVRALQAFLDFGRAPQQAAASEPGNIALFVFRLDAPPSAAPRVPPVRPRSQLATVVQALREHTRHDDLVTAAGPAVVAVAMRLPHDTSFNPAHARLLAVLHETIGMPAPVVRSAVKLVPEGTAKADELLAGAQALLEAG